MTAPPGLSQPAASFFGPDCLGIHHVLFIASCSCCLHGGSTSHLSSVGNVPPGVAPQPGLAPCERWRTRRPSQPASRQTKNPATTGPQVPLPLLVSVIRLSSSGISARQCLLLHTTRVSRSATVTMAGPVSGGSLARVGDPGLEPGASPLSEECSNQLS